ncbi:hypothetical protein [Nocardiopsis coralliicola]
MELERIALGMVTAALLPYSIPAIRPRLYAALPLTAAYALYTLAPSLLSWGTLVLLPASVAASWVLGRLARGDTRTQGSPRILNPDGAAAAIFVPLGLAAVLAAAAALVSEGADALAAARALILDDAYAIALSGFLIATFIGGEVVTHTLHPFYAELKKAEADEMAPLAGAGTAIGWLERSLTFTCTVAGRPEAVAVVVAIKALARFPELQSHQKRFAEYFLIGSLSSIGFALVTAAAVRLLWGVGALG